MELLVSVMWTATHFEPTPVVLTVPPSSPETEARPCGAAHVLGEVKSHI